jgi:hypothetical protein
MNFGGSRLGFWFNNSPLTLSWSTSQTGIEPSCFDGVGGWYISNNGLLIRYIIQPDQFCGGCNPNIQTGQATATINTGANSYYMNYTLSGLGESQDTGYENMDLYLNSLLLISATSNDLDKACTETSPVTQTIFLNPPATLNAFTNYEFVLNFTTADNLYHPVINGQYCYYECALNFQKI